MTAIKSYHSPDQKARNLTPEELKSIAKELLGEHWQSPLAAITGINPRSIRYMVSGERPVPVQLSTALHVAKEMMDLISDDSFHIQKKLMDNDPTMVWAHLIVSESIRYERNQDEEIPASKKPR